MSQNATAMRTEGVLRAGGNVIADAGRLIARHGPVLLLLALVGVISRHYLLQWAVHASLVSGVLGRLVMSLVVFAQLLTIVGALLVMRAREESSRPVTGLLIASAAVILPFLVIYEHYGFLYEDTLTMGLGVAYSVIDGEGDVTSRLAGNTTFDVLVTAAVAFSIARGLTVLIRRLRPEQEHSRAMLRLIVGYAEVVWIFLSATIIREGTLGFGEWWHSRRVGAALDQWWQALELHVPAFAAALDGLWAAVLALVAAAIIGFVVPLAWLALGTLVYGAQARPLITAAGIKKRASRVIGRVREDWIERALDLATDAERRFGGAIGAVILVLRAGWAPVLVFCLAFLVADRAGWILAEIVRPLLAWQPTAVWIAWYTPIETIGEVLQRVLTLALVASAVDALLRGLGAAPALRLAPRPVGQPPASGNR
ncbi:hypothetical protein [Microbacterium sediminis]|uniref:Uncharacterized protein n=1 Tax=Microbacterium sediminis TaxID=904291 RepID=A0A1B9N805_9MICO|nr:hypothetical protein [Microbacterium sediminis]OCG72720.1 hypothetical protein A7J15_10825 [Microbacterium sediminis]QBR74766.1 hypothetical protein E3O41_10405 [Microbacterium sediminis]